MYHLMYQGIEQNVQDQIWQFDKQQMLSRQSYTNIFFVLYFKIGILVCWCMFEKQIIDLVSS